ncbi:hypothetical protein Trisim1_010470, partial [Trichoderma cf. simile WF8]
LLHWWPDLLRRLPHRLGQDLLPAAPRERGQEAQRNHLQEHPLLRRQDFRGRQRLRDLQRLQDHRPLCQGPRGHHAHPEGALRPL